MYLSCRVLYSTSMINTEENAMYTVVVTMNKVAYVYGPWAKRADAEAWAKRALPGYEWQVVRPIMPPQ